MKEVADVRYYPVCLSSSDSDVLLLPGPARHCTVISINTPPLFMTYLPLYRATPRL